MRALVIDGSFVTAKPRPGDIDLIVVLDDALPIATELLPADYNSLSRKRVWRRYNFDVFVDLDGSESYDLHLDFFRKVKEETYRKGVLRVEL